MANNKLRDYNKKRDFKITSEPSGKKIVTKNEKKKLIFVVQEHHARRLHYDFRLELDGVLKSWAVPKGPSLDPKVKRLAVQTEDHPLPYAKFHGTIPQGEYGAGEVFIWDHGTWESEDEDPKAALNKGHLKFRLKGKKLNGRFVLVRTHLGSDRSKKNWLLIKHLQESEVRTTKKVSKKKSIKLENDPWPGFILPQLPRLVTSVPEEGKSWLYEMKFDGYRIQGHVKGGIGKFFTRNALDWSNAFPHLLNAIEKLPIKSAIFDGEIVALDDQGKTHFQQLQNSLKNKHDNYLRYYIFDLLYLDGKDLRNQPLIERKKLLNKVLHGASKQLIYSEHLYEQGNEFYQVSCQHHLEGIVSKLADSPYQSGRNDLWVKTKCTSRQEFVIGGWTDPKGGRTGIGALLLGIYERGKFKYAGKVGTGFDSQTLKMLKKELHTIEDKDSPFEVNSPKGKTIHWARPIKVCEVSFSNWTNEDILRTPVFLRMREDKPAKDIHMETPVKNKKIKPQTNLKEISSPEKILFKKENITKKDVADFYQSIAPVMLPYIADRPLSLVRCPNGSEGSCFFQKHFTGNIPETFHTFPIKEEKGDGIYLSINSAQGLRELVQLNAFEIHAWNCHKNNYMIPDQIVMDFDPGPGVPWGEVIEAAFELKEMLEDLDLKSFVKLTGGKGIHLHIPIAPLYDWDQIKTFSQGLALELVRKNPERYVANMSKKLRKNKIFIDYLRNGYGATAVAPYSLRARPLSSVAMPLEWKELRRVKDPQAFTMKKALMKIRKRTKDPWEEMLHLTQKISILHSMKKAKAA